jgi:hypothetical protein
MKAPPIMKLPLVRYFVILMALLGLAGCRHIGPGTIVDDRICYNEAILTSWKEQTLLNIVRFRYVDGPEFIDVSSVVNGYEHARTASGTFSASIFPTDITDVLTFGLTGSRLLSDKPTITYTPQTGAEFTRNLTNALPAASILNLIESGAPADLLLDLTVESINGIRNRQYSAIRTQEADPEFQAVVGALANGLTSGQISLRLKPGPDPNSPEVFLTIHDKDIPPFLAEELAQMRQLLRLDPQVREFKLVHGVLPQAKDEIAFRTRSVVRIMTYLSLNVQVPTCHVAEGRAPDLSELAPDPNPPLRVYSGCERPCDCYAAVHHQGYWFWIDPRDTKSKLSMAYLKHLLARADTGLKALAPALTIRAN